MASLVSKFIQYTTTSIAKKLTNSYGAQYAISGSNTMEIAARKSQKIVFKPSTMKMVMDKFENVNEVLKELKVIEERVRANSMSIDEIVKTSRLLRPFDLPDEGYFFIFETHIKHNQIEQMLPIVPQNIAGFLWFSPAQYLQTGKDDPIIILINENGEAQCGIVAPTHDIWRFDEIAHMCQWGKCRQPHFCKDCLEYLFMWTRLITLCAIIAQQYLAEKKYEEIRVDETKRVPRKKGGKPRVVHSTVTYKSIDASEIIIRERTETPDEHGEGWLEKALKADRVEYQDIQTRPFTRTYRHERYRKSGLLGKTFDFPNGVTQHRPLIKGIQRVTNVTARRYE